MRYTLLSVAGAIVASVIASGAIAEAQILPSTGYASVNSQGLTCRYTVGGNPVVYAGPSIHSRMLGYISMGFLAQDGAISSGWVPMETAKGVHGWVQEGMTSETNRPEFQKPCHVKRAQTGQFVFTPG